MRKLGQYVLVQHSGWGYANNPQFIGGLELRWVDNPKQLQKAKDAGGLVFPDYDSAHTAAFELMYPESYGGMVPVADRAGAFAGLAIDGLRVFVPHQASAAEPVAIPK